MCGIRKWTEDQFFVRGHAGILGQEGGKCGSWRKKKGNLGPVPLMMCIGSVMARYIPADGKAYLWIIRCAYPPKSSNAIFSSGTPNSSRVLITEAFIAGGPQK